MTLTLLLILLLVLLAVLGVAATRVVQHDPRPRDVEPPRSHRDEAAPTAWYGRPA